MKKSTKLILALGFILNIQFINAQNTTTQNKVNNKIYSYTFSGIITNDIIQNMQNELLAMQFVKEAKIICNTKVIASSEDKNFNYIPKGYEVPKDADYLHITSNNTIYGTQLKSFPKCDIPLVCDMSSDIFSRKINAKDFSLIYAGAQKNIGPAGSTMIMVKKDVFTALIGLQKEARVALDVFSYFEIGKSEKNNRNLQFKRRKIDEFSFIKQY